MFKDKLQKLSILYHYYHTRWQRTRFKTHGDLEQWQHKQLKKFKKQVLTRSPYYANFIKQHGVGKKINLHQFPIINKQQHIAQFDQINTAQLKWDTVSKLAKSNEQTRHFRRDLSSYAIGLSSGTSGQHGLFITDSAEQGEWAGRLLAQALPNLLTPQRIALFLRADNNLYHSLGSKHLQFKFFDLFKNFNTLVDDLHTYQPTILVGPPRVLKLLAEKNPSIKPKKIISCAEPLTAEDKHFLKKHFGCQVDEIYQCTEGFLAFTCKHGSLHFNEDHLIIEKHWLSQEQQRFMPIITDLRRRTQPIVRYQLDDIIELDPRPCPCGSVMQRIAKIEGRYDDILTLPQDNNHVYKLFPDFIRRRFLLTKNKIANYQVEQVSLEQINIKLKPLNKQVTQEVKRVLIDLFTELRLKNPKLNFLPYQDKPLNQKLRRVTNLIPKGTTI